MKLYISLESGSALLDNEIEQRKEVKEGIQGNRRSTGIAHLLLPTLSSHQNAPNAQRIISPLQFIANGVAVSRIQYPVDFYTRVSGGVTKIPAFGLLICLLYTSDAADE